MGTNYYIMTKNKQLKDTFFDGYEDSRIVDEPEFGYEIHICKRSAGWKTLFQSHPLAYISVAKLEEFLRNHESDFIFYDEYYDRYTLEEFLDEIKYFDRDKNGNIRKWHDGSPLICHEEYAKQHPQDALSIKYWQDEDGYDFTDRWFG